MSGRRYSWNIFKSVSLAVPSEKFISQTVAQFKKTVGENKAFLCILIYLVGSLCPLKPLVYMQKIAIL